MHIAVENRLRDMYKCTGETEKLPIVNDYWQTLRTEKKTPEHGLVWDTREGTLRRTNIVLLFFFYAGGSSVKFEFDIDNQCEKYEGIRIDERIPSGTPKKKNDFLLQDELISLSFKIEIRFVFDDSSIHLIWI